MRVLMLSWTFFPGPEGGAERQCRLLAHSLAKMGEEVSVLTSRIFWISRFSEKDNKVIIKRAGFVCPIESRVRRWLGTMSDQYSAFKGRMMRAFIFWVTSPLIWMSRFSYLLGIMWWAVRLRGRVPFDVLHVHESGWLAGLGVFMGHLWGIPVVCKEATTPALGPIPYCMPLRGLFHRLRMDADVWLAQTDFIVKQLQAAGISPGRIRLLRNGVRIPPANSRFGPDKTVLYVGNLTQGATWKAFDVLFEAWVLVARAKPAVKLIVAGAGNPAPWIQKLKKNDVDQTVVFTGWMDDVTPAFASASLFVLPSRIEGMSNALLEAMAWGLPCVVSDIPANTALIVNEANGLVVPVGDAGALANAIVRLLEAPELASEFGRAARSRVESEFGIERVASELSSIYADVSRYASNIEPLETQ